MELMFTDLFVGTTFTAEVKSFNTSLLFKTYTTKKEAKAALKSFILAYEGQDSLTHCRIWKINNIKQTARRINYTRYLKLQKQRGVGK